MWTLTTLEDPAFVTLNGLWKGKTEPFVRAKVIRNTNFRNDGILDFDDVADLEVEERSLLKKKLLRGDIIIERSGGGPKQPVGRVCLFDINAKDNFSLSNFTTALRILDRNKFLPRFVCYYLLYLYRSGYTENLQRATTGIRNLDFASYLKTEIPIPTLEEQIAISSVLWKIQQAIEVETELISVSRELKAALMKKLFTEGLNGEPQKDTEIGLTPESWKIAELGEYFQVKHGYAFSGEHFRSTGNFILMTPGNFNEEGGFRDQKERTKYYVGSIPEGYLLDKSALLIAMTEQKAGLNGSPAFVPESNKYLHNQRLGLVENLDSKLDKRFLYHLLNTSYVRNEIAKTSSGSKVKHTSPTKIRAVRVAIPPDSKVQSRIADTLDLIDEEIRIHQRKQERLAELFEASLSSLMSASIRVTDFDIDTTCLESQGAAA